jgi:hypothetical protein
MQLAGAGNAAGSHVVQKVLHVLEHSVGKSEKRSGSPRSLDRLIGADEHRNDRLFDLYQQTLEVMHQVHDTRQRIFLFTHQIPPWCRLAPSAIFAQI